MQEVWKNIEGHEGHYQVSNFGRIRRLKFSIIRKGKSVTYESRMEKEHRNCEGYVCYTLIGDKRWHQVHREVAMAFIPNPENKPYVNHIDGNPSNNIVTNLEWVTQRENMLNGVKRRMMGRKIAVYCPETDKVYESMSKAERELNLYSPAGIRAVKSGRSIKSIVDGKCQGEYHLQVYDTENKRILNKQESREYYLNRGKVDVSG